MSLISDWENWCRTCGNNNLLNFDFYSKWDSLDEDLLEIMRKLTPIENEMIESGNICIDCRKFLTEIVRFSKQCRKITDMYAEINLDYDCDLLSVRSRYGLKEDEDDEVISLKNPFDDGNTLCNSNELVKLEIKLENIQDDVESEYIFTNSISRNANNLDHMDISRTDKNIPKVNPTRTERQEEKMQLLSIDIFKTEEGLLCSKMPYDQPMLPDNTKKTKKQNYINGLPIRPAKVVKTTKIKKSIRCPICNLGFYGQLECDAHKNAKHSILDYPYDCLKCPKRFVSARGLQVHELIHLSGSKHSRKDKFVCEHCGKLCKSNTYLKEHLTVHSDEYPFKCLQCLKKFKSYQSLQRHKKMHDGIVYKCDVCGLQFNSKGAIIAHMVAHSCIKKFKCNYCGNEYKRRRALQAHLIYHSGLKPYKCPFCDKSFTYGSSCRLHKKTVHPQELAELEASGRVQKFTNLPKLEYLQPK